MITAEHSRHRLFNAQPIFPSLLSRLEVNEVSGNVCAFAISNESLGSLCFQALTSISWFRTSANILSSLSCSHTHTQSKVPQSESMAKNAPVEKAWEKQGKVIYEVWEMDESLWQSFRPLKHSWECRFMCVCVCVNNTKPVFWTHSAGI